MEVCGAGNVGRVELENNLLQIQRARKKIIKWKTKKQNETNHILKKPVGYFVLNLEIRCWTHAVIERK